MIDPTPSSAAPSLSPAFPIRVDRVGGTRLTAARRLLFVRITVVAGFVIGLLLSHKLWSSDRFFPLVPVIHGLPRLSYPFGYCCYAVLLVLLIAIALAPKPQIFIAIFAACIATYSLWDQARWQPWDYQYLLLLIALGCSSDGGLAPLRREDKLNLCRLIVGCTYFYSGMQKMTHRFVSVGFPWVVNTLHIHIHGLRYLGWGAAGVEAGIGLGLLTRRFRGWGMVLGVAMHLFVLYSLGPWGRNWNSIVWPWNVVMIALILILFGNAEAGFADIVWRNRFVYHKTVLVLLGVLPALSFFDLWPSNLSMALYTSNVIRANVQITGPVLRDLPRPVQRYVKPVAGHLRLGIQEWSLGELNVPTYAGMQSYVEVLSTVCRYASDSPDVVLVGWQKDTWMGQGKEIRETCADVLKDVDHR